MKKTDGLTKQNNSFNYIYLYIVYLCSNFFVGGSNIVKLIIIEFPIILEAITLARH